MGLFALCKSKRIYLTILIIFLIPLIIPILSYIIDFIIQAGRIVGTYIRLIGSGNNCPF